jgi:hypothetical protein
MSYESQFIFALCLTCLIEVPLLIVLIRLFLKKTDLTLTWITGTGFLASMLTLPYLWFVLPSFIDSTWYLLIGEIGVIFGEAVLYYFLLKIQLRAALFLSLITNFSSFIIGLFLP